jgi:hypothetical protein
MIIIEFNKLYTNKALTLHARVEKIKRNESKIIDVYIKYWNEINIFLH